MLTPQEVSSKEFVKAVFGGYDMSAVDEFLEQLNADYSALYKENAILKGKIKVLVEKVEEYRSTEDSMRMALLTAQKMGDDIVANATEKSNTLMAEAETNSTAMMDEANAKSTAIMDEANTKSAALMEDATSRSAAMVEAAESKAASIRDALEKETKIATEAFKNKIADEKARLAAAETETRKFIAASQEIMRQHALFLSRIEDIKHAPEEQEAPAAPAFEPAPVVEDAPVVEEIPAVEAVPVIEEVPAAEETPAVEAAEADDAPAFEAAAAAIADAFAGELAEEEAPAFTAEEQAREDEIVDTAMEIDSAVSKLLEDEIPQPEVKPIEQIEHQNIYDNAFRTRTPDSTWSDEDEPTSPRPKFAFENLRFGSNYSNED